MSESLTPTPLERRSPPLGPRAPTTRARRTFWALFAVAVALTVYVIWPFRSPLFLAAVLAAAFQPLLARTERLLKGRRRLAGALLTVLVLGAIVAPIASILAFIAQQITQMVHNVTTRRTSTASVIVASSWLSTCSGVSPAVLTNGVWSGPWVMTGSPWPV